MTNFIKRNAVFIIGTSALMFFALLAALLGERTLVTTYLLFWVGMIVGYTCPRGNDHG